MATSRRQQILEALLTRVQAIAIEAGYHTDVGAAGRISLGEVPLLGAEQDDPVNWVVVVVADSQPQFASLGGLIQEILPIEFQGHARADLEQPYAAAEQLLSDIIKAVEASDRTLGGLTKGPIELGPVRTVPREPGMTTVAIGATYYVPYVRQWGTP